jgi:hypothetical protein
MDINATIRQNPFAAINKTNRGIIRDDVLQTPGCDGGHSLQLSS